MIILFIGVYIRFRDSIEKGGKIIEGEERGDNFIGDMIYEFFKKVIISYLFFE